MYPNFTPKDHAQIAASSLKTVAIAELTGDRTTAQINWSAAKTHMKEVLP